MITTTMKNRISECLEFFKCLTLDGYIIQYLNGFIGVGILDEPEDHITKQANTIWIYGIGFNINGKRIVENTNIYMTEDEAHDLKRCLEIALSKHKHYYKHLSKKQQEKAENNPRERVFFSE